MDGLYFKFLLCEFFYIVSQSFDADVLASLSVSIYQLRCEIIRGIWHRLINFHVRFMGHLSSKRQSECPVPIRFWHSFKLEGDVNPQRYRLELFYLQILYTSHRQLNANYLHVILFLAYFPRFDKNERRLMRSLCCLSVYPSVSVHLAVYPIYIFRLMRPTGSPWCCLLILPRVFVRRLMKSVCLCVFLQLYLFYVVRVLWDESSRLILPRTSCY
jgi:hypothetical protein